VTMRAMFPFSRLKNDRINFNIILRTLKLFKCNRLSAISGHESA